MLPTPAFAESPEGYAPTDRQSDCAPVARRGVVAFRDFVLKHEGGQDWGITRACDKEGRSEHKEGRAWDWHKNASAQDERSSVDRLLGWLLRSDDAGEPHALWRRLGLMYVIWDGRIWSTRTRGWQPYGGASSHADHVHFSFGWPGALAQTSFFRWLGLPPDLSPHPSPAEPHRPAPGTASPASADPWRRLAAFTVGLGAGLGAVVVVGRRWPL